jgi:hypothetical protein
MPDKDLEAIEKVVDGMLRRFGIDPATYESKKPKSAIQTGAKPVSGGVVGMHGKKDFGGEKNFGFKKDFGFGELEKKPVKKRQEKKSG